MLYVAFQKYVCVLKLETLVRTDIVSVFCKLLVLAKQAFLCMFGEN